MKRVDPAHLPRIRDAAAIVGIGQTPFAKSLGRSEPEMAVDVIWAACEDAGLSPREMRQYLEYVADLRLASLGMPPEFGSRNPFAFMDLQDVQELTNFFERRVSAYQVGVEGEVAFDEAF